MRLLPSTASGNGAATGVPSQRSQLLMRRLSTMIRPMSMEWKDIGCSYNTSTGMRTVLKVGFDGAGIERHVRVITVSCKPTWQLFYVRDGVGWQVVLGVYKCVVWCSKHAWVLCTVFASPACGIPMHGQLHLSQLPDCILRPRVATCIAHRRRSCATRLTLVATGVPAAAQSVYGKAEPGDMLALMGPSGAGKSTLMDILAGRKSVGNLTGSVLVNSLPRKKDEFARKTAYVPQVRAGHVQLVVRRST